MISIITTETEHGYKTIVQENRGDKGLCVTIKHEEQTPPKKAIDQAKFTISQRFAFMEEQCAQDPNG